MEENSIVQQLHPLIRKLVLYLEQQDKIDVISRKILVRKPNDFMVMYNNTYANTFTLLIPYAGQCLELEVKFFNYNLGLAPEFCVKNDLFFGELTSMADKILSWRDWDPSEPSCLHKIIIEFMALYKAKQVETLSQEDKYEAVCTEFLLLTSKNIVKDEDIEVMIDFWGIIHFLVALNVDFSEFPRESMEASNPEKPKSVLLIKFIGGDLTNVQSRFYCVPKIKYELDNIWNYQLPQYPSDGHLVDYIQRVEHFLQNKVHIQGQKHLMGPAYISRLLTQYRSNILEYNLSKMSKAALIFETNGFLWILCIRVNRDFPKRKPSWLLRSVYCFTFQYPLTDIALNYPYNPKWSIEDMVSAAMKYTIKNHIPNFLKRNKNGFA